MTNAPRPESYHTQHSPFGAFASFTLGLVDAPGGFGQSLRGPAKQNVYVGFRGPRHERWQLLPFLTPPQSLETAFTGDATIVQPPSGFDSLQPADYTRTLRWASDTWRADGDKFGFSLLSPFGPVPDPATARKAEARFHFAPLITGWIEYDNRAGKQPVELVFGVGAGDDTLRPLTDTSDEALLGFASGGRFGYATAPAKGVALRQGFDLLSPKFLDYRKLHVIAGETGIVFTVPAGRRKRFPLVLGFHRDGIVTTGLRATYAYTRWFRDLEDVLAHGLSEYDRYEALATQRDRELARSRLSADQQFLVAQATHSYYGSTQLLWQAGKPLWVVNEGEYRMINTFDLTVDHLFFELAFHPWAVRDALDLFVRRYAYRDKHGLSFTHDMGVNDFFTPPGRSSYECDGIEGCFSHMTMEQLLNWVVTGATYAAHTGDRAWLRANRKTFLACAESLRRRDDPDPARRDGLLKLDTDRCAGGSEITTYDSLDVSLGQARNNLYLGVKTLGAWVLLERAFIELGLPKDAAAARATADLLAHTLTTKFETDTGFFPAVFERGNRSRILPAVEGFVYPLFLGYRDAVDVRGRFAPLFAQLRRHINQALQPGVCLDVHSGGWKMSSTSTNTWFSKIAIAQHVIRKLFPEAMTADARAADRVHADWQRTRGCGEFAMCDQIRSDTGIACGSRYYPRGVTTYLWLSE